MVYRSRLPEIVDLLRKDGRCDELRFRRDLQTYWPEVRAEFHDLLTPGQQNEFWPWFPFPWGHIIRALAYASRPCRWGLSTALTQCRLYVIWDPSLFTICDRFGEMQARESAMQVVPTTSQSHNYDNRRRADGRSLQAATLRSAISLPQTDDSQDHDCEDTRDQYHDSQHNDGQHDDGQDNDGPSAEILAANSAPEDDDICPICREGYSDAQPSASLIPNCGHFFHLDCMVQWINSNSIDGQPRDRCICGRRKFTGILSQFYGEVIPPQNSENF
ncbi:hypothetical protein BPOR_0447g00070 [Botrytis porri]|uniref:RING-type E3 ubiquitin transferase n=1 Tax=Botrytis porri TaxID=87229 RepID=A0A4Z1KMX2_9HELO|nr:hypothetical protein BPOR_0447g00070 [Botrytis porri]